MSLVIEDGTKVADATSYATVDQLRVIAAARGVTTLSKKDADCEVLLIKAMDFLYGLDYIGDRLSRDQPLDWPRYNVVIEGWPWPPNDIPRQLWTVQCILAIEYMTQDLLPTTAANAPGPVTTKTVGPITVQYANTGRINKVPVVAKAKTLLNLLLKNSGMTAIRI